MATRASTLHLNYFHYPMGHHEAAWRHPQSDYRRDLTLEHVVECARIAEDACFDSVFLAQTFAAFGYGHTQAGLFPDPLLLATAMAAHTRHVGLITTMSTTFTQPYDLALRFATFDHLTGGRAGWNIVTSTTDPQARNFGMGELPDAEERYRRAAEYVEVCLKLWAAWDDDALVLDKQSGVFADVEKVRPIDHHGDYFEVQGPLGVPPSPQRRPVLVQAGTSGPGMDFAARYADAVFTVAPTLEEAVSYATELRALVERYGRPADSVKLLPGLAPIVAKTESEAKALKQEISDLIITERCLSVLETFLHMDLGGYSLDGPPPPLPDPGSFNGSLGRLKLISDYVEHEQPTLRELAAMIATSRGHLLCVGDGHQIADVMEEWKDAGAADGFNIMPLLIPSGLADFAREVVPVLQQRGLLRTSYPGGSLRQLLGVVSEPTTGQRRH